ncbi:unnamed protein product [Fraxinus pennsylvanica]|uniref:Kinesin motor domain-containing protein n=1 Tax=Fraxinus pennsylvanica TaxID=56036 RepID=A0AAD2DXY9_9LAMI|nr:unnamed protein product [Fraxinus pennsylvanica]
MRKISLKHSLTLVYGTKLKVDLTEYVENHEFVFDAVLNEEVSNDEVYRETVEPIVPIIFQRTKATCFAYGQTGKPLKNVGKNLLDYLIHAKVKLGLRCFRFCSYPWTCLRGKAENREERIHCWINLLLIWFNEFITNSNIFDWWSGEMNWAVKASVSNPFMEMEGML